jgi:hypothetical protein
MQGSKKIAVCQEVDLNTKTESKLVKISKHNIKHDFKNKRNNN